MAMSELSGMRMMRSSEAQLLDFRENLWLHMTSVLVSQLVLRGELPDAGIISPSFHDFAMPAQKRCITALITGGFDAADDRYSASLGFSTLDCTEWYSSSTRKILYDACFTPSKMTATTKYRKKRARRDQSDKLTCERVNWCRQRDGSPCGVWYIAILEILLTYSSWDDCLYNLLPFLRMRFLYKTIRFVGKEVGLQLARASCKSLEHMMRMPESSDIAMFQETLRLDAPSNARACYWRRPNAGLRACCAQGQQHFHERLRGWVDVHVYQVGQPLLTVDIAPSYHNISIDCIANLGQNVFIHKPVQAYVARLAGDGVPVSAVHPLLPHALSDFGTVRSGIPLTWTRSSLH
ncbi:hypothetical protein PHMEG_00016321 [Phytophthora megakarya]|uniref:Uncharacterized protein n=1 Tax=Phytophthora megakarya TaxID=4795 RepID=A0A225VZ36_9STRA|nr:hypothetical protein PHMEG_00016321 [Phytophthora megakarya]